MKENLEYFCLIKPTEYTFRMIITLIMHLLYFCKVINISKYCYLKKNNKENNSYLN